MKPIRVTLDDGLIFGVQPPIISSMFEIKNTMEIDDELLERYLRVAEEWQEVQLQFEQLYRIQEKLNPWKDVSIPNHRLLS